MSLLSRFNDPMQGFFAIPRQEAGWSAYQANDLRMLRKLEAVSDRWQEYATDAQARGATIERFANYVYQWY